MKSGVRVVLTVLAIMIISSGCSVIPIQQRPLASGEVRLLSMQVPETVGSDLPYDILVTFEAVGSPQIKKACFTWLSEKASVVSPDLYCYAAEVASNDPIGSACSRWLAEGPYAQSSPVFCAKVENVNYGNPGTLTVRIQSGNVKQYYNKLECHVEYLRGGETDITNKVSARMRVE